MKNLFFFIFLLSVNFVVAQSNSRIESILKIPRTQIAKLDMPESNSVTYLPSIFSESKFQNNSTISNLQNATVIKVYYVYTLYKLSPDFNQLALDRKRFNWLNANFPSMISDPFIQWEIIEQTGCSDFTQGDSYFHGFVVVHRPFSTEEHRLAEIDQLTKFLDNPTEIFVETLLDPIASQVGKTSMTSDAGSSSTTTISTTTLKESPAKFAEGEYALLTFLQENLKNTPEIGLQRTDVWVDVKFTVKADGSVDSLVFIGDYTKAVREEVEYAIDTMPNWKPAIQNGKPVESTVSLQIRVSYSGELKGMYTRDRQKPGFRDETKIIPELKDDSEFNLMTTPEAINVKSTAVYKGLEIISAQKKIALVMDVTGSMTTHIASMMHWVRTHSATATFTSYTFFNDGDGKTTKNKKIGETGGIYMTKSLAEADKIIKETMMKGNGGEAPENDMEAVRYAFTEDLDADAVLLIGDNYSEVRDINLLNEIKKPVHVLLCAAPKFVRCEYLKIAKQTGGTFILNGEIIELASIVKGETRIIQGVEYFYNGNDFELKSKDEVFY